MKTEQWKLLKDDEPIPDYAVMSRGGRWMKLQVRKLKTVTCGRADMDADYEKEVMGEWQDVTWEEE